jgi:hypothetical protein
VFVGGMPDEVVRAQERRVADWTGHLEKKKENALAYLN